MFHYWSFSLRHHRSGAVSWVIEASRAPLTLMTDTVNNLEKRVNYRHYRGHKPVARENWNGAIRVMLMNPRNLRLHLPKTPQTSRVSTLTRCLDRDELPASSPTTPLSASPRLCPAHKSIGRGLAFTIQHCADQTAVIFGGSWQLAAHGERLSSLSGGGQWNYEHSSQSLYRPVLKLFVFRTQRNFTDHGDWSLRSLGFSPPPGKTDEMCARVWGIWGLFRWDWERSHALFILLFRLVSPGLPLCVNGANICVVKFVPGLEMAHDTSPAQPGPSVQVYSRLVLLARVWLSFRAPSLGQKISRVWQCARGSFTLAMPFTFCPEREKTGEGEKLKMEEDWSRAQGVYPLSMCKSRHQLLSPVASIFRSATNLSVSLGLWGCECVSEKHTQEHGEEERREKRERQRGVSETQKEGQWTNLAALLCWVFLLKSTGLCRRGLPWDI